VALRIVDRRLALLAGAADLLLLLGRRGGSSLLGRRHCGRDLVEHSGFLGGALKHQAAREGIGPLAGDPPVGQTLGVPLPTRSRPKMRAEAENSAPERFRHPPPAPQRPPQPPGGCGWILIRPFGGAVSGRPCRCQCAISFSRSPTPSVLPRSMAPGGSRSRISPNPSPPRARKSGMATDHFRLAGRARPSGRVMVRTRPGPLQASSSTFSPES